MHCLHLFSKCKIFTSLQQNQSQMSNQLPTTDNAIKCMNVICNGNPNALCNMAHNWIVVSKSYPMIFICIRDIFFPSFSLIMQQSTKRTGKKKKTVKCKTRATKKVQLSKENIEELHHSNIHHRINCRKLTYVSNTEEC